ncbi:phosphoserine phosphatase SerB [Succinivibrio sp.]|uniref:phosphoserine phosphatase SerB n=1 Tax=Succinivibrio sp. TaxID=2053619 RepID=UPI00386D72D8
MSYVFIVKKAEHFNIDAAGEHFEKLTSVRLNKIKSRKLNSHVGGLFSCEVSETEVRSKIKRLLEKESIDFDVWCSESFPTLKRRGEICLDMDMTSVQIEGIDEIARRLGVFGKVSKITEQAMHGGMDFTESLKQRVALLEGGSAQVIEDVKSIMNETDGLDLLMNTVTEHNWVKGICSGGFVQLICVLEKKYALNMVCANSLEIKEGKLTGRVDKRIVDAEVKLEGVLELKKRENIDASQIIVLGDGANDLKMIDGAALGIAYHAKPLVQKLAPACINHSDLTAVALLLLLNS